MNKLKVIYCAGDCYRSVCYRIPEFSANSDLVEVRQWKRDISDPKSLCGPPRINWASAGSQPIFLASRVRDALSAALAVAYEWQKVTDKVFDWGGPKMVDLTEKEDEPS